MPQPFPFDVEAYVGDSRTWELSDLTLDGEPIDLSDTDLYRVTSEIAKDRAPGTTETATLAVTFPSAGVVRLKLTPSESEKLGALLEGAFPESETSTRLSAIAAIDVQVEVLDGAEVVDRTTLLSDDITISGDVTR